MAALDKFHYAVKNALIKDGWTITDDPLSIQYGGTDFLIDLGAENLLAAEKADQHIAIEVKSFLSKSPVSEFHTALGQFINYEMILGQEDPLRVLYMAVSTDVYRAFFSTTFAGDAVKKNHIRLIVCRMDEEKIEQWIK